MQNWSFGERKKGQIQIILRPFSPSPSDLSLCVILNQNRRKKINMEKCFVIQPVDNDKFDKRFVDIF